MADVVLEREHVVPSVLVLLGCYWPGNDATGANQSFRALVRGLGHEYRFRVVARAARADVMTVGASGPICWCNDGFVDVAYVRPSMWPQALCRVLNETPYDLLLINGFHDREFTIPTLLLRRLGLIPRRPTILSPRGELGKGALSLKSYRKRIYMSLTRSMNLLEDIWLHATEPHEHRDIWNVGLRCRGIMDASDTRFLNDLPISTDPATILGGPLRIVFLGRITPVKNVHFIIEILSKLKAPVILDLYGPINDRDYWARCEDAIRLLPSHIIVTAKGVIPNSAVPETLGKYDLFFLPTLGENFGHAINEALSAGLPVLISDQTPWCELETQGAGWALPLDQPDAFVRAIESFITLSNVERLHLREGARALAERRFAESTDIAEHREMFLKAIAKS